MKRYPLRAALVMAALAGGAGTVAWAGETTNRFGITMVDIPAGTFVMGSCKVAAAMAEENKKRAFIGQAALEARCLEGSPDPQAGDEETPQRHVRIKAFQLGKTEVTLGQFKQFIAAANRTDLVNDDFMQYNRFGDDAPVVQVSWDDAQAFVAWLNRVEGGGWRLPSEAEWEYACRAGQGAQAVYCGGPAVGDLAWFYSNSGGRQQPVGQKRTNAWGLHDMSGNAWEWVQDCWHDSYAGAPDDGAVWSTGCRSGAEARRVLRGGSWYFNPRLLRSAIRNWLSPGDHNYYTGFRIARTVRF